METLNGVISLLQNAIAAHPVVFLGTSFILGAITSFLISRKCCKKKE